MFVLAIVLNTIANCLFHFIWNKDVFMVCGWVGQHKHLALYSLMVCEGRPTTSAPPVPTLSVGKRKYHWH